MRLGVTSAHEPEDFMRRTACLAFIVSIVADATNPSLRIYPAINRGAVALPSLRDWRV